MDKYIIAFVCVFINTSLMSCDKSDDVRETLPETGYEQYGNPFDRVPDSREAVIYQVNVRSFSKEGNLAGVEARLDNIKELGANVIYLMPIYPVGVERSAGGLGSPYAIKNYKEINSDFGTLENLRSLVDKAHEKGLSVILDWVANHTAWDNPWITEHPEWYQQDADGNIIIPPGTGWQDVAQLNYDNQEMRKAMIDAMSYWVYNANIDGFRCDAADFVPDSFWTKANDIVRNIKKQDFLMLAEGAKVDHFNSGFDYIFGFGYFETLKSVFNGDVPATALQDENAKEYKGAYIEEARVVRYTNNHDVNRTDGTPMGLFGGKKGSLAAFVVASYMKSVPMIYNGQEIGYPNRIDFFEAEPIDWENGDTGLLRTYKDLIAFRKNSEAVQLGAFSGYSTDKIAAFTMGSQNETVFVLSNLTDREASYLVSGSLNSMSWQDALTGTEFAMNNEISLAPYQYLILKTAK